MSALQADATDTIPPGTGHESGRRVLVLEPRSDGHRGYYLQWSVEAMRAAGWLVHVMTLQSALAHPAVAKLRDGADPGLEVTALDDAEAIPDATPLFRREFRYWSLFRKCHSLAGRQRPDLVFIPYLDYCLYMIGLLGSPFGATPWSGIAMRPSFHYPRMGIAARPSRLDGVKRRLLLRALNNRTLAMLFSIDEALIDYFAADADSRRRLSFVPEPFDLAAPMRRGDARERLNLKPDKWYLLVFGAISHRKGLRELTNAMRLERFPGDVEVLVAGVVDQDMSLFLDRLRQEQPRLYARLHLFSGFVSSGTEAQLFAACDAVWLGYVDHFAASGVLVQAGRAARPVMACDAGLIGWQTRRHRLGRTFDPKDADGVAAAVNALKGDPRLSAECAENGQRTFAKNSLGCAQAA